MVPAHGPGAVREDPFCVRMPIMRFALPAAVMLAVAGCGSSLSTTTATDGTVPQGTPHVIQPTAGQHASAYTATDPVGDIHAHAPPLAEIRSELKLEAVAVKKTSATYINPLQYVNHWERTDQGVDANMPVGAPILAPSRIKVLAIEPNWYLNQPLVYFELLDGPDAGRVQFVAEEITSIAPPGSILDKGQVVARYARTGTGIEYGWSTLSGITLARATSGYEEGQITPAGRWIRAWLNALGAGAGPDF
jgi:hypothetical protein